MYYCSSALFLRTLWRLGLMEVSIEGYGESNAEEISRIFVVEFDCDWLSDYRLALTDNRLEELQQHPTPHRRRFCLANLEPALP